jgi:hypothetical protein
MIIEDCPSLDAAPVLVHWLAPQEAAPIPYGKHPGTRRNTMPAVIDTPELELEHVETYDLTIEMPQTRRARPGFWRSLVHGITTYLTPTPREWQAPSCSVRHPFETPIDRLVREHPSLSVYALAIV